MPKYKRRVMAWGCVNKEDTLISYVVFKKRWAVDFCPIGHKVVRVWIERVDKRRRG